MAKIQIKSEKLTPFGGIFSGHGAIYSALGLRCTYNNAYAEVFQTDFG